jgi:hypothetical protein
MHLATAKGPGAIRGLTFAYGVKAESPLQYQNRFAFEKETAVELSAPRAKLETSDGETPASFVRGNVVSINRAFDVLQRTVA